MSDSEQVMNESEGQGVSATIQAVQQFWEYHVNNEYYTRAQRASEAYFEEIERKRYRWHYHLGDLFNELRGRQGKLLEIGCGIGVDSIRLAACGFDVTGVDLTQSAIELARQFAQARGVDVDFRVGNAESLDFTDASFDAVYSFGVLHHTPHIEAAIADLRRVLKPSGVAYVMLYHTNSLVNLVHRLFRLPYESPRHMKDRCPVVYTFTRWQAHALFAEFSDVRIVSAYPFTYGFRHLTFWVPEFVRRALGRWIGWHLMIRARR